MKRARNPVTVEDLLFSGDFSAIFKLIVSKRKYLGESPYGRTAACAEKMEEIFSQTADVPNRWAVVLALIFHFRYIPKPFPQEMVDILESAKELPSFIKVVRKLELQSVSQLIPILASISGDNRKELEELNFTIPCSHVKELLVDRRLPFFQTRLQLTLILRTGKSVQPLVQEYRDLFLQHTDWGLQEWSTLVVCGLVEKDAALLHFRSQGNYDWDCFCDSTPFLEVFQSFVPHLCSIMVESRMGLSPLYMRLDYQFDSILRGQNTDHIKEVVWWHNNVKPIKILETTQNPVAANFLLQSATTAQEVLRLLQYAQPWVGHPFHMPDSVKQLLEGRDQEVVDVVERLYERRSPAFLLFLITKVIKTRNPSIRFFSKLATSILRCENITGQCDVVNSDAIGQMMLVLKDMVEKSYWAQILMTAKKRAYFILTQTFTDGSSINVPIFFASYHQVIKRPPVPTDKPIVPLYNALANIRVAHFYANPSEVVSAIAAITEEHKEQCHAILVNFFVTMKSDYTFWDALQRVYNSLPPEWQDFVVNGIAPSQIADINQQRRLLLFLNQQKASAAEKAKIQDEWDAIKSDFTQDVLAEEKKKFCEKQVVSRRIVECTHCKQIVPCKYAKFSCCELGRQQFICSECEHNRAVCPHCRYIHHEFCIILPE